MLGLADHPFGLVLGLGEHLVLGLGGSNHRELEGLLSGLGVGQGVLGGAEPGLRLLEVTVELGHAVGDLLEVGGNGLGVVAASDHVKGLPAYIAGCRFHGRPPTYSVPFPPLHRSTRGRD